MVHHQVVRRRPVAHIVHGEDDTVCHRHDGRASRVPTSQPQSECRRWQSRWYCAGGMRRPCCHTAAPAARCWDQVDRQRAGERACPRGQTGPRQVPSHPGRPARPIPGSPARQTAAARCARRELARCARWIRVALLLSHWLFMSQLFNSRLDIDCISTDYAHC